MYKFSIPIWLSDLKSDFIEDKDQNYLDFFMEPSELRLKISTLHSSSLAFGKAHKLNQKEELKHFESQYRLCLNAFAYKYWESHGTEEKDIFSYGDLTAQGLLMRAIHECLDDILCYSFDETLTKEEYETFISLGKSFYEKYYKIYPEKLLKSQDYE